MFFYSFSVIPYATGAFHGNSPQIHNDITSNIEIEESTLYSSTKVKATIPLIMTPMHTARPICVLCFIAHDVVPCISNRVTIGKGMVVLT